MNILYCIPHLYNAGGMERVVTQKINWLITHTDHTITIVTTECAPKGTPAVYFPLDPRVEVIHLNIDFNADYTKPLFLKWFGHMHRMRAYRRALQQFIASHTIDLCISTGGKEIAFARHLPCRTMIEMHFAKEQRQQLLMANHKGKLWALFGHIRTAQLIRAVKPIERLVVLTESDKAAWERAGCTNVICIPNICSLDGQQIPQTSKTNTVLAVGRLHEQKGFDLLLQAWKKIENQYTDWTLRIVGEGPKRADLENQIHDLQLQHVVLAGRINDVKNEYTKASLFVLSSRYEGLPLALIEAMWSELPCVAFDCPNGPAELLANERGWLVPAENVEALAMQLEYAMRNPDEAEKRARKAQQYAQQTYSEAAIMPQWKKIIEQ